jgi:hypothetical protein
MLAKLETSPRLIQITTSYFCCGIIIAAGRVLHAAPILQWAIGKPEEDVHQWVRNRGGDWQALEE